MGRLSMVGPYVGRSLQKNLMKCCKEFLLPGGKQIPFCAYNTLGYREQARQQLQARERARNLARRKGVAYVPEPITFTLAHATGQPAGHAHRGGNGRAHGE